MEYLEAIQTSFLQMKQDDVFENLGVPTNLS